MFWGETKTWYGIPGADAEKFEDAIKAEAPELFEQQPALLYQLVTMMNPGRLLEKGVRVAACDQRPNEFVITFPKAYHCGFNHGVSHQSCMPCGLYDDPRIYARCSYRSGRWRLAVNELELTARSISTRRSTLPSRIGCRRAASQSNDISTTSSRLCSRTTSSSSR